MWYTTINCTLILSSVLDLNSDNRLCSVNDDSYSYCIVYFRSKIVEGASFTNSIYNVSEGSPRLNGLHLVIVHESIMAQRAF